MKELLELFTTVLAFGIGTIVFKKLGGFFKMLFIQVCVYLLGDCIGIWIARINGDNQWVYNFMMPFEAGLLSLAAYQAIKTTLNRIVISVLYLFFFIIYILDVNIYTGIWKFAYHASIVEGLMMSALFTFLLYEVFMGRNKKRLRGSIAMASFGMLVYFACSVPYLSLMFYFQEKDSHQNDEIFQYVITSLGSLRYLFIAIAFYMEASKEPEELSSQISF